MIIVTGRVTARPDSFDDLRQASLDHVRRARPEDECLLHSDHVDVEDPLRLSFYEEWREPAALKVRGQVAGSRTFLAAVRAPAASSEPITVHHVAGDA